MGKYNRSDEKMHGGEHNTHGEHKMLPGAHETGAAKPERHDHHAMMVADFRKRFWVSLIITITVLILSPAIQKWTGISIRFTGDI